MKDLVKAKKVAILITIVSLMALVLAFRAGPTEAEEKSCEQEAQNTITEYMARIVNDCRKGEFVTFKFKHSSGETIYWRIHCSAQQVSPGNGLTHPGQRDIIQHSAPKLNVSNRQF